MHKKRFLNADMHSRTHTRTHTSISPFKVFIFLLWILTKFRTQPHNNSKYTILKRWITVRMPGARTSLPALYQNARTHTHTRATLSNAHKHNTTTHAIFLHTSINNKSINKKKQSTHHIEAMNNCENARRTHFFARFGPAQIHKLSYAHTFNKNHHLIKGTSAIPFLLPSHEKKRLPIYSF